MDTKGTIYKDKYDTSHSVEFGQAMQMAEWIFERLKAFWVDAKPRAKHPLRITQAPSAEPL